MVVVWQPFFRPSSRLINASNEGPTKIVRPHIGSDLRSHLLTSSSSFLSFPFLFFNLLISCSFPFLINFFNELYLIYALHIAGGSSRYATRIHLPCNFFIFALLFSPLKRYLFDLVPELIYERFLRTWCMGLCNFCRIESRRRRMCGSMVFWCLSRVRCCMFFVWDQLRLIGGRCRA